MSRRSTSTLRYPSNASNTTGGADATTTAKSNSSAATSLESLLKSCGALKSVMREKSDVIESTEFDPHENSVVESDNFVDAPGHIERVECATKSNVESCEVVADGTLDEMNLSDSDSPQAKQVASVLPEMVDSVSIVSILKLMREESRASIKELQASQEAAAAGQSAVLKALLEVISRSSSMRDNTGDALEQKLFEFEERLLQRISHVRDSIEAITTEDSKQSSDVPSSVSGAARKNGGRSWEEIRNDLLLHGDSRESQGEADIREAKDLASRAAINKANSSVPASILEVPSVVDPDSLTDAELRQVFVTREEFILTLISRLRQSHQQSSGHLPAEKLKGMSEHLPASLEAQVMQTLQQHDDLARIGELELSLERARLSRQLSKLEESRQLLERYARQLGFTLTDDGIVSNPQKPVNNGSNSRRWLSKLGFGQ